MPRQTPQSALHDRRFIVRAPNQNDRNHGKKRIGLTYIYLLIIQRLVQDGRLPVGRFEAAPMSLQAKGSHGHNQAAHQLLGELTIAGQHLYSLPGLTFDEQRALTYCTSAVSDIHKLYNFADNYLETWSRPAFVTLANDILFGRISDRETLWNRIIDIVSISCVNAKSDVDIRHRVVGERDPVKAILEQYRTDALALRGRAHSVAGAGVDHWIREIRTGAF